VLVARSFIRKGTLGSVILKTQAYQLASVACSERLRGALNDPRFLKGLVTTTDIYPGSQLVRSDFSGVLRVSLTTRVRAGSYATVTVTATRGGSLHDPVQQPDAREGT
jgi:hypothetical protein